jgi:hypothetical protein
MTTVAEVQAFVSQILNNQTVNHNSAGQGMYQMTAFAPNMPGQFHLALSVMKEFQAKGEEVPMKYIQKGLPGLEGIAIAVLSTQVTANEKPVLPCYTHNFFKAEQVKTHLDNFKRQLNAIELELNLRNKKLMDENVGQGGHREYRNLLPSNLGMSVNI